MHYAESECVDIVRPLHSQSQETFKIHSVMISKKLKFVDDQQTVVIVPGGPGQSATDLKTALQKREVINSMWGSMGVNVVLFDPRGTGMSPLPKPTTSYDSSVLNMNELVEDLKAVIEKTARNKPVVLLAHSAGGHVVIKFAEKYPELVSKIALLSASISSRQMGELTLGLQADDSYHWRRFLKTVKDETLRKELDAKYQRVEDVVKQQQKARILKKYVHPEFKKISINEFRSILITRLEKDPTGATFIALLDRYLWAFKEKMEATGQLLVPAELRALKLKESDFLLFTHDAKSWIQREFVCGEGLTEQETLAPIVLDGLTLNDHFCHGAYHTGAFDEPKLENIQTPVLFFSGQNDYQVPTYIAREIVGRLPNAKLVVSSEAGHLFADVEPHLFYVEMEKFIIGGEQKAKAQFSNPQALSFKKD